MRLEFLNGGCGSVAAGLDVERARLLARDY